MAASDDPTEGGGPDPDGGRGTPWWASGVGPDAAGDAPHDEWDRQDPGGFQHHHHPGDHARDTGRRGDPGELPSVEACQICPVCSLIRLVGDTRPDVVAHLAEAARHLTLAARTIVDAQARGFGGGGLQHIPIDEDDT